MKDFFAAAVGPKRPPRRRLALTLDEQHAVIAALLRDLDRCGDDTEHATTIRAVLVRLTL